MLKSTADGGQHEATAGIARHCQACRAGSEPKAACGAMLAMLWAGCLPLATLLTGANAHGAITVPGPSRNAVDSNLPPWSEGVPEHVPFEYFCPYPTITEASRSHGKRNLSAANGQAVRRRAMQLLAFVWM